MILFVIFAAATLIELYVLISVGSAIGAFSTVLLVILTAFMGSILVKRQGFSTLRRAQQATANGQNATFEMLEGVIILCAGFLLLTPGFITDFMGLLGLIPQTRVYLLHKLIQNLLKKPRHTFFIHHHRKHSRKSEDKKDTIEGEFWRD